MRRKKNQEIEVKILLLCFHYPPDISAGAFRCEALVHALSNCLPSNSQIDIITTSPHRFDIQYCFQSKDSYYGNSNISIQRVNVGSQSWGVFSKLLSFVRYSRHVLKLTKGRRYDLVIASSSKLMTSVLGRRVAGNCRSILYHDIRDNFVRNISSMLPLRIGTLLSPVFSLLEKWSIAPADKINLVSEGFRPYFFSRYPKKLFSFHTNGIDQPFIELANSRDSRDHVRYRKGSNIKILYAGNIGSGQGLAEILPELAARAGSNFIFHVIGDGVEKKELINNMECGEFDNVVFKPPMSREDLLKEYLDADVLFLHLNVMSSLQDVLPSKIFEYAATGKPIWAGVSGFAANFLRSEVKNSSCFSPGDVDAAMIALARLDISHCDRSDFVDKFRRDKIMNNMAHEIVDMVKNAK